MNTKAVTFSMPVFLHHQLQLLVGRSKMSQFVCEAVQEKISEEKKRLRKAYMDAKGDSERNKTLKEWSLTEAEGWA
ncbi:MAG: hypothetical protein HY593_03205 [Candidatus Omnitrophica bacterium]|nr:hypothetical protein [Candidatus Omnitrophota bacterium]